MTNPLKNVPRWAWFVAAGVGVGGIALRTLQNKREAAAAQEAGTTGTDPATGQSMGTAPPGVIVPPVIMGGDGGGGEGAAALSDLAGVIGQGFADVLGTAAGLAWTPAEISGLITTTQSTYTDQVRAIIGMAGPAPQPVAQQPTVVNVSYPAPAPTPAAVPVATGPAPCPATHPNRSSKGCYRCYKDTEGAYKGTWTHVYADGITPTSRGNSKC